MGVLFPHHHLLFSYFRIFVVLGALGVLLCLIGGIYLLWLTTSLFFLGDFSSDIFLLIYKNRRRLRLCYWLDWLFLRYLKLNVLEVVWLWLLLFRQRNLFNWFWLDFWRFRRWLMN
jgi:hypothetical protein